MAKSGLERWFKDGIIRYDQLVEWFDVVDGELVWSHGYAETIDGKMAKDGFISDHVGKAAGGRSGIVTIKGASIPVNTIITAMKNKEDIEINTPRGDSQTPLSIARKELRARSAREGLFGTAFLPYANSDEPITLFGYTTRSEATAAKYIFKAAFRLAYSTINNTIQPGVPMEDINKMATSAAKAITDTAFTNIINSMPVEEAASRAMNDYNHVKADQPQQKLTS